MYNFRVDNVRTYVKFSSTGVEVLDCKVEVGTPYSRRPDNEKPDLSPPPSAAPSIVKEGTEEEDEEEEEEKGLIASSTSVSVVTEANSPL